jgi:hypothetical protein
VVDRDIDAELKKLVKINRGKVDQMKLKFGLLSVLSRRGKDEDASSPGLLVRLLRDESGSYIVLMTLVLPILIGVSALGTEGGFAMGQPPPQTIDVNSTGGGSVGVQVPIR